MLCPSIGDVLATPLGDTGFYSGQTSYLSMKTLTFTKDENKNFCKTTANLSYDKTLLVTSQTLSQLAALEPCIKANVSTS